MKLELKLTNDWLEAAWYEETITVNDVEKEIETIRGVIKETIQEEATTKAQVYCESFSGHNEHIAMLRVKAKEFNTELDEALIAECVANFKYPTEAELAEQELKAKLGEAQALLDSTQFKFGDDYDQKDTPEWLALKVKRQEAREFIRINDVPNP